MMIKEQPKKLGMKELKVNIPVKYHLQLHSLKVMEGRQIHGVVQEALDKYFASIRADQPKRNEERDGVER
jgi:hypothetical protein